MYLSMTNEVQNTLNPIEETVEVVHKEKNSKTTKYIEVKYKVLRWSVIHSIYKISCNITNYSSIRQCC